MKLSEFIRETRLDMALSQQAFADFIGVSITTINQTEKGRKVGYSVIRLLSEKLNVSIKELREMNEKNHK